MLEALGSGLALAIPWQNFLYVAAGVFIGVLFGAIPGLTGGLAVVLLLPFSFWMHPVAAMALLLGCYKGSRFGASISAITFGVPGEDSAAATVFDGYELTKQGKPYKALNTALYSSVAADWLSDLVVIFSFIPLGMIALKFGPRELFALMVVAMSTLIIFAEGGVLNAIIGAAFGFMVSMIGLDPIMYYPRLTFGIRALEAGIPLLPFFMGLFAFSEMLLLFSRALSKGVQQSRDVKEAIRRRSPEDRLPFKEWLSYWREILLGTGIGTFLGMLPGPGSTMAAFTSYAFGSRLSKNKGRYGTGVAEGVASAESGNSATVGPTLIPLFAFGIPGSGMAAIFMGAFLMQGINPGPVMITDYLDVMLAIFMLMLLANAFNLVISKVMMIPLFTRLGLVSGQLLVPLLIPLMMIGIYAMSNRMVDILIMVAAGVIGLIMRRFQIPLAPTVVAFMIGPMLETHFRRGLIIADSPMWWFASPIAMGLYLGAIALALYFVLSARRATGK